MFTKEEQKKLTELTSSNEDFAYFINKINNECKLLTSQISHEIRNPLTLIKSTAQLIESTHPDIKEIKFWTQLVEDINDLETLLTEFSIFNRSELITKQEQNLLLLLKSVLNSFRPLAEQNGIELSLYVKEEDIPYFIGYPFDSVKLKQVFTNLLKNAFEATSNGDFINIECKVTAPSSLIIAVHNNGNVIPSDIISNVFNPFVTYKSGGSGLGLAICSNIVAAHDGTIEVISSEEKTSFIIHLPILE